ncbi:MAG: hypothetical protein JRJ60_22405 [Deltaproteobacteria bacterium]|nr:hypothetical protein [Deltaproteobacteria bacterium]
MTTHDAVENKALWLLIEEKIAEHGSQDFEPMVFESTVKKIAQDLDNTGYNVSLHGGHMLQLRYAIDDTLKVGRPLMQDFNEAVAAFTLDDVMDPRSATRKIQTKVGEVWPKFRQWERKPDILQIVEKTKLNLLIDKAKSMSGDEGIRLLIEEEVFPEVIVQSLSITEEKFTQVNAQVEAERAERARVRTLLEEVADKSEVDKAKHLFSSDVNEALIVEIAGIDPSVVDGIKQSIEKETAEKRKQEEEAAAKKAAEAAGPPLEEIPSDELLDYIEEIRDILSFSDKENEIRKMGEDSSIPKCLIDIAVSEPDKLDELEEKAGG